MKEIWTYIQMTFAAIGGWLGWFLGGFDGFLYALVTFVVIDYVTGLMCAILEKKLSSVIGARVIKVC
jgi:phage-related holin